MGAAAARSAALLLCIGLCTAQAAAPALPATTAQPLAGAQLPVVAPVLPAIHSADLTTPAAMSAFGAQWRNQDVRIVEVPAVGNARPPWKQTYDLQPKAGAADFDDSAWLAIEPQGLLERRGGGHLFMTWFRTTLTMPTKLSGFEVVGARAALHVLIDDYAEVWVNGQMLRALGRPSPGTIQGFNMPNRVMLSESIKPGDKFQIAILAINGPISVSPTNFVFFREARVEFFR